MHRLGGHEEQLLSVGTRTILLTKTHTYILELQRNLRLEKDLVEGVGEWSQ
jgi:hypothetical protein